MSDTQKTYPRNNATVEAWASEKSKRGISKAGNIIFEGDKIYSYGSHYLMAQRIRSESVPGSFYSRFQDLPGSAPSEVVLLNSTKYSMTTNQHRHLVKQKVRRHGALLIEVDNPRPHPGERRNSNEEIVKRNLKKLMDKAREKAKAFANARKRDKSRVLIRAIREVFAYSQLFRKDLTGYLRQFPDMAKAVDVYRRAAPDSSRQGWCVAIGVSSILTGRSFEEIADKAVGRKLKRKNRVDTQDELEEAYEYPKLLERAVESVKDDYGLGHVESIVSVDYDRILDEWQKGEATSTEASRASIYGMRVGIRPAPSEKNLDTEVLMPPHSGNQIYVSAAQVMRALILATECREMNTTFSTPSVEDFFESNVVHEVSGNAMTSSAKMLMRDMHFGFGVHKDPRPYQIREDGSLVFGRYVLLYDDLASYGEARGWMIGDVLMIDEDDVEIANVSGRADRQAKAYLSARTTEQTVGNGDDEDELFSVF